jgi:hypothetical protein
MAGTQRPARKKITLHGAIPKAAATMDHAPRRSGRNGWADCAEGAGQSPFLTLSFIIEWIRCHLRLVRSAFLKQA